MDSNGDFVASCSNDGKVVVTNLCNLEADARSFTYPRPVKAVALDPGYSKRNSAQLCCGGLAENLVLNTKGGWFSGNKDYVLHKGEGPIMAIKWRSNFIAWANNVGVKLYDARSQERIAYIERGGQGERADMYRCCLSWEKDDTLLIGWAKSVKVARVREKPLSELTLGMPSRYVEIIYFFDTEYYISGIAPYFDKRLVILGYVEGHEDSDEDDDDDDDEEEEKEGGEGKKVKGADKPADRPVVPLRPQLRIVTKENEELSSDALDVRGFGSFSALDYKLEPIPGENLFYILSPRDVVVARPRDQDDHVTWLLERERYEEALKVCEESAGQLKVHNPMAVGEKYLASLVQKGEYGTAAAMMPQIFKKDSKQQWETWAYVYSKINMLKVLVPFIPVKEPRLSSTVYELVLNEAINHDVERFLRIVKQWPPDLYDVKTVIEKVASRLKTDRGNVALMDALAVLYTYNKEYAKTLEIYLQLKRDSVFDLLEEYSLFDSVPIRQLLEFKPERAIELFVQHTDRVPIREVVAQLLPTNRKVLHMYLHRLFGIDMHIASEFHELQVELYAEYDRKDLLPFLRQSNHYPLEPALKVCRDRELYPEMVFILGRMGNSKEALTLIIKKLGNVTMAIEYVVEADDKELWEDLITYSLQSSEFIAGLLEKIGAHIDPLLLLKRIPETMEIPGLRDKLVKILSDYQLHCSLRQGCAAVLRADAVVLSQRLNRLQKKAYRINPLTVVCSLCHLPIVSGKKDAQGGGRGAAGGGGGPGSTAAAAGAAAGSQQQQKAKQQAADALSESLAVLDVEDEEVGAPQSSTTLVSFFCTHSYHLGCLVTASKKEEVARHESPRKGRKMTISGGTGDTPTTSTTAEHLFCMLCQADKPEVLHRARYASGAN